jgi:myo-inositol-1(or 4)-monophosphatase
MNDLEVAVEAARAGAEVVRHWFRRFGGADYKGVGNPVTVADRKSEAAILEIIHQYRPDDEVLAEEGGGAQTRSGRRWVIDPLDGTVNFVHGIPQCAVSVAVEDDLGSLAGVVIDPFRGEEFAAQRGRGAHLDGDPIRVSPQDDIGQALLCTGFAYDRHLHSRVLAEAVAAAIGIAQDVRRLGAAALDLAWVACGRLDGHWEFGLAPWDVAAGSLLVTEAGGRVTDSYGEKFRPEDLVATNGLIHDALRQLVAAHRPQHRAR